MQAHSGDAFSVQQFVGPVTASVTRDQMLLTPCIVSCIELSCCWYSATVTSGCFLMVASRGRSTTTKCLAFMVTEVAVGFAPSELIRIKNRI